MGDDGREADVQFVSNFLVDESLHNEAHHLNLAVGENFALQGARQLWKILAPTVSMLFHHEKVFHQRFFRHIDAKAMELGQLTPSVERQREYNGLGSPLGKEQTIFQHNVHGHEIMVILIQLPCQQFGKRAIHIDSDNGHHMKQNVLQPYRGKRVGVNNSYFGASLCHKFHLLSLQRYKLAGENVGDNYDQAYIEKISRDLAKLDVKNVVITGVSFEKGKVGASVYHADTDTFEYYFNEKIDVAFHGTGDVFSSAFAGALMNGKSAIEAAKIAADFVVEAIKKTLDDKKDHWYGVKFEKAIPSLIKALN